MTSRSEWRQRGVIFDVDGLILDTEEVYCRTFNDGLRDYGVSISPQDYTVCVGHPVEENAEYAVKRYELPVPGTAFRHIWMERFETAIEDPAQVIPMPGFFDLLDHLRDEGRKLGIASSTARPRMMKTLRSGVLSRLDGIEDLAEVFGAIFSGSDVEQTKPAPDIYLLAAKELGLRAEECLVLEDSQAGVAAGKAAGMTVIAVPNFYTAGQDHRKADLVVESLKDVLELIAN